MSESVPQLSASAPAAPEERVRALIEIFGQKWVSEFNDPVVFRSCSLSSKAAMQFFTREFAEMSRILFADTMYRRRAGFDQALLDTFIAVVTKKLADVQALIAVQCERLIKLCESNGQPIDAAYVHQQQMLVPIISPHAASYLRCLVKLEELHRISGSAMLNGVIDGEQRRVAENHGHKAIRSLSGVLRNEYTKVRREAERVRAEAAGIGQGLEHVDDSELQAPDDLERVFQEDQGEPGPLADPGVSAPVVLNLAAASIRIRANPDLYPTADQPATQRSLPIAC